LKKPDSLIPKQRKTKNHTTPRHKPLKRPKSINEPRAEQTHISHHKATPPSKRQPTRQNPTKTTLKPRKPLHHKCVITTATAIGDTTATSITTANHKHHQTPSKTYQTATPKHTPHAENTATETNNATKHCHKNFT
jgi:hypothetical protein